MQDKSDLGVVLPFPFNLRKDVPGKNEMVNELLENEDVEKFFRYVIENDLRVEALQLLEKRVGQDN